MKDFNLTRSQTVYYLCVVQAETAEDAIAQIENGDPEDFDLTEVDNSEFQIEGIQT